MDKAKEAVKARNKQKFSLEIEKTIGDAEKLSNMLTKLKDSISNMNDIEASSQSIIYGIRRDLLLGQQNIKRVEQIQKVGESYD